MLKHNLSIVVPAAGLGIRLRSNRSKSLTQFDDGEFLYEKQLNTIKQIFPNNEIIYVVGFQANKIKRKLEKENVTVILNKEFENTNAAYSIGLGLKNTSHDNALIIYGDLFFNANVLRDIEGSGNSSFIVTNRNTMEQDEVGYLALGNTVTRMNYGFDIRWSQIMYLKHFEKQQFAREAKKTENRNMLGFEVLNNIIGHGAEFDVIESNKNSFVCDIDSQRDLDKINKVSQYLDFA